MWRAFQKQEEKPANSICFDYFNIHVHPLPLTHTHLQFLPLSLLREFVFLACDWYRSFFLLLPSLFGVANILHMLTEVHVPGLELSPVW